MNSQNQTFILIILAALLGSCVTPKSGSKGGETGTVGWSEIEKTGDVRCFGWPVVDRDVLDVSESYSVPVGDTHFLMLKARDPSAQVSYFATPYRGGELAKEFTTKLGVDRSSVLLGAVASEGTDDPMIDVVTMSRGKTGFALQRSDIKGKSVATSGILERPLMRGRLKGDGNGFWILFGDSAGNNQAQEAVASTYHLAFSRAMGDGKMEMSYARVANWAGEPTLLVRPAGTESTVRIFSLNRDKNGNELFYAAEYTTKSGRAIQEGASRLIELPIGKSIESWTVIDHLGGYFLAWVEGDSVVGQAELKVASLVWEGEAPKSLWVKSVPLVDVHVSEPVFLSHGGTLDVALPRWTGGATTIGVYRVGAESLIPHKSLGLFPRGARLMEAFVQRQGEDVFTIMRSPNKEKRWQFEICHLLDL